MNHQSEFPSYSIIVETENLSVADLSRLSQSLQSIANQDVPIERAVDVIVQDSGNVPPAELATLQHAFPWISLCNIAHETGHYEAKMQCLRVVHGDVVIFCDSDCVYQPGWLRHLLLPFSANEEIQVVGGETQMEATSPYALAMVLTHVFSPYSSRIALYASDGYYANNVAFRREFLKGHCIPTGLPLYRGNCVVHCRGLADRGIVIWKQPLSRATHALPENVGHLFNRFLRMGCDALQVALTTAAGRRRGLIGLVVCAVGVVYGKLRETATRGWFLWKQQPRNLARFIGAMPVVAVALTLFITGVVAKSMNLANCSSRSTNDGS